MAEIVSYRNVFPGNLLPEKRMLHHVRRSNLSCCSKILDKNRASYAIWQNNTSTSRPFSKPVVPVARSLDASTRSPRITRGLFLHVEPAFDFFEAGMSTRFAPVI
jgi:hypothetical protein